MNRQKRMRALLGFKQAAWLIAIAVLIAGARGARSFAQNQPAKDAPHQEDLFDATTTSSDVARQLGNRDAQVRRSAAEELARRAASDEGKMVAGYRAQEKDARVRLALDWALYRFGSSEKLFAVVSALDSSRSEQAIEYLKQLETPEALYKILPRANGNTQIRLLEVLASVGNEETLEQLKTYVNSFDPGISDAAKFAAREINLRLTEPPPTTPSRRRQVGNTERDEDSPEL
ncbi:MAG TPA: hypothetical protein VM866_06475 [Pyrinomonadaceae bacterium]|jgi:hypothetical protein|nr:hypothetical protein [Pyrinomonadaceae bacterium]